MLGYLSKVRCLTRMRGSNVQVTSCTLSTIKVHSKEANRYRTCTELSKHRKGGQQRCQIQKKVDVQSINSLGAAGWTLPSVVINGGDILMAKGTSSELSVANPYRYRLGGGKEHRSGPGLVLDVGEIRHTSLRLHLFGLQ